jgi:hypothetical protein
MSRNLENQKRLAREWYLRNRELTKARAAAWAAENPEKVLQNKAKYRQRNAEKHNAYNREWFAMNKDKRATYEAKRRALLLQRTPQWLTSDDEWMIGEAYHLAQLRSKKFGFDWHVDHVLPLQGRKVSGLHMPMNLQVIPGTENCKKHAAFTP